MPRISTANINTIKYWDDIYRRELFPTGADNNVARYRKAAEMMIGDVALDIGCGQGGLGVQLGKRGNIKYMGVDFSREAIGKTIYPSGKYLCIDWQHIPFQMEADTVYILELIEHVNEPEALIKKAASLAKRRLVIGTPRYKLIPFKLHRGEHQWDFTTQELIDMLSVYGKVGTPIPAGAPADGYDIQCHIVAVDL